MGRHDSSRLGFTLIELLVVIAIISVLMAIIVPALHKVRFHANEAACLSNLRQVNLALMAYANEDSRTRLPLEPTEQNPHRGLLEKLGAHQGGASAGTSPARQAARGGTRRNSCRDNSPSAASRRTGTGWARPATRTTRPSNTGRARWPSRARSGSSAT